MALYADGNGKYGREYAELWNTLVPESGFATSLQGELVRIVGRLASEYYRNGNLNWDNGYENMARCLQNELNKGLPEYKATIDDVIAKIFLYAETGKCNYRDDEDEYDILTDYVVEFCQKYPEAVRNDCPQTYDYQL